TMGGGGGGTAYGSFLGEPYAPGFYEFDNLLKEWRDKGDLDGLGLGTCMAFLRFDVRGAVGTVGGRGLGRSYALLLASQGAKVVVNDPGGSIAGDGTDA